MVITGDNIPYWAAIGSNENDPCGTITINGGVIIATNQGSGIGGGKNANGGTINLNGGVVNASSIGYGEGGSTATNNLSWFNNTDRYTSDSYRGTVTIADGKAFSSTDNTVVGLSGTVSDNSILAGKTLVPCLASPIHIISGSPDAVSVTPNPASKGETVTVTVTPVAGFSLQGVTVTGATSGNEITLTPIADYTYTFIMPFEAVNVTVNFVVPYLDLNGVTQYAVATPITSATTVLTDGWYAVTENVTTNTRIDADGNVNIVLCDGATMANGGIETSNNKSLTFWGQSNNTGKWVVNSTDGGNGIGNNAMVNGDAVIINGGTVRSQGYNDSYRYGIRVASLTLRGGSVWANRYSCTVKMERFFTDEYNNLLPPGEYTNGSGNGYYINGSTLTASGKIFLAEGDWCDADKWYQGELPSSTDCVTLRASVTIPAGCVAQAYKAAPLNNATVTIQDGGQLIYTFYDSSTITASNFLLATVEKTISGATNWSDENNGWYFIASPMYYDIQPSDQNKVVNMLTADAGGVHTYDLYQYVYDNMDEGELKPWYNYRQHQNNFYLSNQKGYLYANANTQTIRITGRINPYYDQYNHNTVRLANDGWNLIGNPYTCAVSVDKAFGELNNGSVIANKPANSVIMPCTGIMVYGEKNEMVTFTKVDPSASFAPSAGILNIALEQQVVTRGETKAETIDNAIVSFSEDNILPKFHFMEQAANLYIPQGNEEYAIAYSNAQSEMPVNFKANKNGNYTITVNPKDMETNYLHLIDNLTGADVDLLVEPSYTFAAKMTDYESRFKLVFSAGPVSGDADGDNETFAFIHDGDIIVNGSGTLQVIDMLGHVLVTRDVHSDSCLLSSDFSTGVYVLRLINGDDVKTQKIVVR